MSKIFQLELFLYHNNDDDAIYMDAGNKFSLHITHTHINCPSIALSVIGKLKGFCFSWKNVSHLNFAQMKFFIHFQSWISNAKKRSKQQSIILIDQHIHPFDNIIQYFTLISYNTNHYWTNGQYWYYQFFQLAILKNIGRQPNEW